MKKLRGLVLEVQGGLGFGGSICDLIENIGIFKYQLLKGLNLQYIMDNYHF